MLVKGEEDLGDLLARTWEVVSGWLAGVDALAEACAAGSGAFVLVLVLVLGAVSLSGVAVVTARRLLASLVVGAVELPLR